MPSQSSTLHRTPRSSTSVRRRSSWHHSWPLQTITKVGDAWRQEIGHGRATRSHSIFWCDGRNDLAMAPSCKILQCRQNRFDPAWSKLQAARWLNSIQTSLKAFSQTLLRFQYSTLPGFEYCRRLICFKQEFQQPPLQARRLENWPDGGPPKEASQFGSSHLLGWCKININKQLFEIFETTTSTYPVGDPPGFGGFALPMVWTCVFTTANRWFEARQKRLSHRVSIALCKAGCTAPCKWGRWPTLGSIMGVSENGWFNMI